MTTYSQKISEVTKTAGQIYPQFPYHNFQHGLEVWCAARNYALLYNLDKEKRLIMETAAILHDVVFVQKAEDNEEKSAEFAKEYLPKLDYTKYQIQKVSELILATKWPTSPKNLLEEIICDSDLDSLGRKDFFQKSRALGMEWGYKEGRVWHEFQLSFLTKNQYYTKEAKRLRDPGKKENIRKIEKLLRGLKC